ncbi:MAG TPA: hypothetical protein VFS43_29090 [Polyangiaceae bacterium]|nr:hypothetical protein [Polyangiaceae bacterium]
MKRMWAGLILAAACCAGSLAACGGDDDDDNNPSTQGSGGRAGAGGSGTGGSGTGGSGTGGSGAGGAGTGGAGGSAGAGAMDPQVPPTDPAAVQAWLAQEFYKSWECEAAATPKTDGDPAIHAHANANRVCSNVLLASSRLAAGERLPVNVAAVKEVYNADGSIMETVVSVKKTDNGDPMDWYWYGGPERQGFGIAACSDCHSAANSDAGHPGLGDFVYFQVTGDTRQLPPTNLAAVKAWLAQEPKPYADWSCEAEATPKTDGDPAIHVHAGSNRVCSNAKLAAGTQGPWPAGAAAVKEIYNSAGELTLYAVEVKTSADSQGGQGWYWYEGLNDSTIAEGFGDATCTGCHSAANSDAGHPGAGDYVYFRVPN